MNLTLRAATADDRAFARKLDLDNMRAVTARVLAWDEAPRLPRHVRGSVQGLHGEEIVGWVRAEGP